MRVILAFLLAFSACARAQSYFKGQAARIVIGQPTFTAQASGPSAKIIGAAAGVAYANGMLFVADSNHLGATPGNHRVLIYLTLPQELPPPTAVLEQESTRCNVCFGTADVVLGQPDFETTELNPPSQTTLREPTAVASDGKILAVADTDNNRVLLWKSIPTTNGAPADVVVGQPDFNSNAVSDSGDPRVPTARSLRGPQGVWLQDGKLFVADTVNNRILIWNQIPTQNQQAADMVLGQPDFGTVAVGSNLSQAFNPQATTLRSPVSVTSDGHRLYVADLGYQRVLIWNSIPTSNQQAADVVVGQPDMTSALPNHVARLCRPVADSDPGSPVYPSLCEATLAFPRFALSDGQRLYISDGGNDRVLVYNEIPTRNGARSDAVLGQIEPTLNQSSDNAFPLRRSAPDTMRTPCGLAHDGTNLYVTDPFDRRVLVFSEGQSDIPYSGIRNAASRQIFAVGSVLYGGTIEKDIDLTITIDETDYTYKTVENDSFANIVTKLSEQINAGDGDSNVLATPNPSAAIVQLTAREPGVVGNDVKFSAASSNTKIATQTSSATLRGGGDAAQVGPGTLLQIIGENLSEKTEQADMAADALPRELGKTRVYVDGVAAPLLYVSPQQINIQLPWEMQDTNGVSVYVRYDKEDGSVYVTVPRSLTMIAQNPGIFAFDGADPRPAIALHTSGRASGTVLVDGQVKAGDVATVKIADRAYTYTARVDDKLENVRDEIITLINASDPQVFAFPGGQFVRIRLRAREAGEAGNGIKYSVETSANSGVILTPTTAALCCANEEGGLVTEDNPALPGETITVYATGLGLVKPQEAQDAVKTGEKYTGPILNAPVEFVSSLAGGRTANVLQTGLKPGTVGLYEVQLELNSSVSTNPRTAVTIAQSFQVSNIVTIPVVNPNPSQ